MTTAIERVAGIGAWRMSMAARLLTLSANACRLLRLEGPPPTTLDGLVALCHPEDRHLLREACNRLLSSAEGGRVEVEVRMPVAGRQVWFRHCAEIDRGPADDAPALIGILQDVSWHRQALQHATTELKAQVQTERDRLKAAASAGIVGVWDWHIPQDVLVWDEVMYRLYGLEPKDFGGAYEAWSSAVHPEDRAGAEEAIAAALRGECDYEYVYRVIWPRDGSIHFIKSGAHTIFDKGGEAVRMVGVNHDVTEQIVREAALKEATRVAIEANMAKSEFLARMSHEIRTPMNAVVGLSAMGMELPDLPHRAAEYMSRIHQSSMALMGILNAILDFSKIEARQMELDPQEFELEALVETTSELFALSAHQKGLQLLTDIDPALPRFLVADAPKLGQILNNLLGNAIKFTASGQVSLRVRRLPSRKERDQRSVRLQFAVQDTGIGIAPHSLGELFLPFSQANGSISRRYGGSGLGLVISQRLCEMMGGRIEVDSRLGAGSRFSFELELPVARKRLVAHDGPGLLYQRVLVVDDLAQERQMIARMLENWHVDVVQAGGGREAIEWISRSLGPAGKPFDLVLLDWDMPEVDGREVARWIQQRAADDPLHRGPVILIMAAASDRERVIRAAGDLTFEKLLHKPVTASRLLRALSAARGASSMRAAGTAWQAQRLRATPIAGAQVLLVEDTADSQLVATDMLERMGLRVTVAGNGQQALEVLQDTAVDIILMDVHMPVMNGLQAARLIRAQAKLAAVPVLAMTAAALPQDRADCAAAGMVEVITKPIDPEALLDALLRWVKHRAPASTAPAETPGAPATAAALEQDFPEIAGIDRLDAARRLMGNATLFHTMLVAASTELESKLHAALAAAQRGHRTEAAQQVHALCGSLGNLGAREAWALAARTESSLRNAAEPPPPTELHELGQAVTALAAAIRQTLTNPARTAPGDAAAPTGEHATPEAPSAATLDALLTLLDVHDVKALDCWHTLQPTIQARHGGEFCKSLRAAMEALDFTKAAQLLRSLEAAA